MNVKTNTALLCLLMSQAAFQTLSARTGTQASIKSDTTLTDFADTTLLLNEVTVKSNLPKTRVKGDAMRTIVNGTLLEKAGTCTDVLSRIPQVSVSKEGAVEVFGRGETEVYINGRKVQDTSELSRIQSDHIQSIDVVQNPGARYAASVKAVVRIALKKAKGEGLSFTEQASAAYQYGAAAKNNFDLNYRLGGLDITGSLWCGEDHAYKSLQENKLTYMVSGNRYRGQSKQNSLYKWRGWSPQLQVNYLFDGSHAIGAFYKYDRRPWASWSGTLNTDSYENEVFLERSESTISQHTTFHKHIFNAYYNGKLGKLSVDFNVDGLFDSTDDPNATEETTTDILGNRTQRKVVNHTESANRFWAAKLVLSYPVWKGTLSIGGEYSHNNRSDKYTFSSDEQLPVKATDTNINEIATAGFAEYGRQFGRVFAQIGLRYEHLGTGYYEFGKRQHDMSRSYGDLFPTAVVSMPIGNVQMSLSYRQDIKRPDYSSLTNSTIYINRYTYQTGNPYLKPTYTKNLTLSVAYRALNLIVHYARTKDVVTMLTEPYPGSDDPLLSMIHPVNGEKGYNKFVANVSYRPVIGKWHPMWTASVVLQNYHTLTASGSWMTLNSPFWQFAWNNDIELPLSMRLNIYAQGTTRGDYDNLRINRPALNVGAGIQRDFSLRKLGKLTVDLRCRDIFNTNRIETTIYGIRELVCYNPSRRYFSLDVTWKFNEARSKYRGKGAGKEQKSRM